MHEYASEENVGRQQTGLLRKILCWMGIHLFEYQQNDGGLTQRRRCARCGYRQRVRESEPLDGEGIGYRWDTDNGPPPGPKPTPPPPPPPKQMPLVQAMLVSCSGGHTWGMYVGSPESRCVNCGIIKPHSQGSTQNAYVPTQSVSQAIEEMRSPRVKRTLGC